MTPVSPGTCTLSAAGNAGSTGPDGGTDWNALTAKLTVSLTVANTLADQLIEFAQLPDVTYGVAPFAVSATSVNAYYPEEVSSGTPTGLPISYAATPAGVCTVDGSGNVTITGAGICTITASQAGNSAYNPAGSIGNQFTVDQEASSITFPNPGTQADGTSFSPSATASDGEAVTFTASGDCSTTGNGVVQLTAVGSCTVTAHSVGDANFTPPADVPQTFTVTAGASSTTTAPTNSHHRVGQQQQRHGHGGRQRHLGEPHRYGELLRVRPDGHAPGVHVTGQRGRRRPGGSYPGAGQHGHGHISLVHPDSGRMVVLRRVLLR